MKLKFSLIGCGAIANKHVAAIRRLNETATIVSAYDLDSSAASAFNEKYSIPVFSSIEEMVETTNPDVLVILSPSGFHAKNVLECIKFKKHFVVEKPLSLRLSQIDRILEECDKNKLKIFVVQQNRFNPPIQKLKEALDRGRFGKLVLGSIQVRWCRDQSYYDQKSWRGTWALDGGVLTNQASHHLDMLIWMMGGVKSVVAKTATRLVNIEAEDTGVAILNFKNGALGVVEATTATRPKDLGSSISILGEKGSVEIGGFFMNTLNTWNFSEFDEMDTDISSFLNTPTDFAWNHTEFFKDVIKSINENKKGLIDGLEGRKSIELINALYESAEKSTEVSLQFFPEKCKLGISN